MGCCGRGRFGRVRSIRPTRRNTPPSAPPERVTVRGSASKLCEQLAEKGQDIRVRYIKGILAIPLDGNNFDLFSAVSSQGCQEGVDWVSGLKVTWSRMSLLSKDRLVKNLGKTEFTIRELFAALG